MEKSILILAVIILGILNGYSQGSDFSKFIPDGYLILETHIADLNNDKKEDYIFIIKDSNKERIVVNKFNDTVDRNRRGIIILFKKNKRFKVGAENFNCFSSENEDGGFYYQPQLNINVEKGNVIINFNHGRYGFWSYKFRFQKSNFNLIEYSHSSNYGPIINQETTICFLNKIKLVSKNISEDPQGGNNDIFNVTKTPITIDKLITLSEIKYFEQFKLEY